MKSFEGFNDEKYIKAKAKLESQEHIKANEKLEKYGVLGITKEDHEALLSSAPDDLEKNPGKTRGEIMSEEEILDWYNNLKSEIEELSKKKYEKDESVQRLIVRGKKEIESGVRYLKEIGRLPEGVE